MSTLRLTPYQVQQIARVYANVLDEADTLTLSTNGRDVVVQPIYRCTPDDPRPRYGAPHTIPDQSSGQSNTIDAVKATHGHAGGSST